MTSRFRVLASLLAPLTLAMALPAAAGDVDTHFDRARGKPQVVRSPAENAASRLDATSELTTPGTGRTVTAVVTQLVAKPCNCDGRK